MTNNNKNILKTGSKINNLTLTGNYYVRNRCAVVECICDCKKIKWIRFSNVLNGHTKSCGCLHIKTIKTHGLTKHPLYTVWKHMNYRCYDKKSDRYNSYGLKGVIVCTEWKNNFKSFFDWAILNGWEKHLQLDKDILSPYKTGKEYSPEYCCFVTQKENMKHTSRSMLITYNNRQQILSSWCEELNLNKKTISNRLYSLKWDVQHAFEMPIRNKKQRNVTT